jgi:hypothetical protein
MNNNEKQPGRRRAILLALVVALFGLTIAPGFQCTAEEKPDGTKSVQVNV